MIAKYMNILDAVLCQSLDQHCVTCCGHNFFNFFKYKKREKETFNTNSNAASDGTCFLWAYIHAE